MKSLEIVYWLRLGLGVIAGILCAGYGLATNTITSNPNINTFINGFSIALVTYILSYYLIKFRFSNKIDDTRKMATSGLGIFLLSWIVTWVILYTINI